MGGVSERQLQSDGGEGRREGREREWWECGTEGTEGEARIDKGEGGKDDGSSRVAEEGIRRKTTYNLVLTRKERSTDAVHRGVAPALVVESL